MAFKNYNNNDNYRPSNTTYSSVSFPNPDFMDGSRLSISYFNKLLTVSIAKKSGGNNTEYPTYDTENQKDIYLSLPKAKILYDLIQKLKNDDNIHNVCVETNKGLLMISDGKEFNSESPCLVIYAGAEDGSVLQWIYQFKPHYHNGAYNYDIDSKDYQKIYFDDLELEAFENALLQYYNAGTYAIAASVMEASMYKRQAMVDKINAIAEKVGVQPSNGGGNYSNHTSFISNDDSKNSGSNDIIPKEYESATYDDIVNGMM